MRLIIQDLEVLVPILEERRRAPADQELRGRERRALQLLVGLLEMIQVQVNVAPGPDELPGCKIALLGEHVRQQRVRSDVERYAQKDIGAALIELTRKPAVVHPELEQGMTRR